MNKTYLQEHFEEFLQVRLNNIAVIGKTFKMMSENIDKGKHLDEYDIGYIKQSLNVLENDFNKIKELID
jgi:hypothetical protein